MNGFVDKDTKSRAQRQMKTEFSVWLCRDGVSEAESKHEKSGTAAKENGIFSLAMSGRSVQVGVKVRKVGRSGKRKWNFQFGYAGMEYPGRSQSMKSRAQKQSSGCFCRDGGEVSGGSPNMKG